MKRRIRLTRQNVSQTFRRLVDWLGQRDIEHKLKAVRSELQTARGFYLDNWVRPKNRWWIALEEAMDLRKRGLRFQGRIKGILWPLETAAKLSALYSGMPAVKREEFRRRILGSNHVGPVLMEIDMAAHFFQDGFTLEWLEQGQDVRTAEFICRLRDLVYEVECKTKTVDAGRMVGRAHFYQLVDLLAKALRQRGLHGKVDIVVPGSLPGDHGWQRAVTDKVLHLGPGQGQSKAVLNDGTSIVVSLSRSDENIATQDIASKLASAAAKFSYIAVDPAESTDNVYVRPLVISVESKKKDAVLKSIMRDLRDAKQQLSGNRTGIIVCFVPEWENIDRSSDDSLLGRVASLFFEKHAPDSVYGVTFISDRVSEVLPDNVEILYPSRTFCNPGYNQKWGRAEQYMASSF